MTPNPFKEKTVMVIGGTGSFGYYITNELLKRDIKELKIFSRDEEKQFEMSNHFQDSRINFIIGNIRDYDRLCETLDADYLFHAAALKIIPICEKNVMETIKTNLLGTLNIKKASIENRVQKAIFLSTDKAVKPVNTYGMTKGLAEKIWISKPYTKPCIFNILRYGNIVGSRGSVIPFFKKLIIEEKTLPITHPSMTRFMLTLRDATILSFHAIEDEQGGKIFIPKNPACKITNLVEALVGKNYPTEIIGIRPGEKIAETLISEEEIRRTEDRGDHYVIHPYGYIHTNDDERIEFTSETTRQLDISEIHQMLMEVPI